MVAPGEFVSCFLNNGGKHNRSSSSYEEMVGPRLPEMNVKTDALEQQKRQNGETNPMELLSETIEIVEQNQWNRRTKSMVLFLENGIFAC